MRELAFLNPGVEITLGGRAQRKNRDLPLQRRHRTIRKAAWPKQTGASSEAIIISRQKEEVFVIA